MYIYIHSNSTKGVLYREVIHSLVVFLHVIRENQGFTQSTDNAKGQGCLLVPHGGGKNPERTNNNCTESPMNVLPHPATQPFEFKNISQYLTCEDVCSS